MPRRRRRLGSLWPLLVVALLGPCGWSLPAGAQGARADDVAAARAAARPLAKRAYASYESGDYAAAIELFRAAEAHFHAPPHLLYLARCQVQLDQLVEARDTYLQVASEKLERYAPDPFRDAQAAARSELDQLRPRIPRVTIHITGAQPGGAKLWIDDRRVEEVLPVHELNPGPHTVRAEASGQGDLVRQIVLAEGSEERLDFAFRPAGEDETNPMLVPALVSFGLGAAGLGVGIATGVASLQTVSDIEDQCVDGHCPPASESDADHAMLLGNLSTVGFVVAGVGVATGATLLLLGMSSGGEPDQGALRVRFAAGGGRVEIDF